MMKRILLLTLGILLAGTLVISSCSESETTTTATPTSQPTTSTPSGPKYGGTITQLWRGAAGNLGWQPEAIGEINGTLQLFFEGLVKDDIDGTMHPWLATSWDIDPQAATIVFHLREGVKFHDGSDFNAEVAKWNMDQRIELGKAPYWKEITVLDDYTVKVQLTEWRNYLLTGFTTACFMHSKYSYDTKGLDWLRLNPVGTGAFLFDSYEDGVQCVAVKNPNYWKTGHPYVDKIIIKYIPDWTARKAAFLSGEGDTVVAELGKETADLRAAGFDIACAHECTFVCIPSGSTEGSPWVDKRVRQAASYAIDLEALAEGQGYGEWEPAYHWLAPYTPIYDPNFKGRGYDPDKAKQLLKEAGYESGFKTQIFPMPGTQRDCAVAIQDYLGRVGIDVEIVFYEAAKFFQFMNKQTWDGLVIIGLPNTGGDYFTSTIAGWYANLEGTIIYISKASPDEVVEAVIAAYKSPESNVELMQKATDLTYEAATLIPVYQGGMSHAIRPYLKDTGLSIRGAFPMYWNPEDAWLDK
jgi:peptide/nickel transport system substrate-binding protein